jgi:hypothetical protein
LGRVNFNLSEAVDLWWPNGYGLQKLYDLEVSFAPTGSQEVTTKKVRVAFR